VIDYRLFALLAPVGLGIATGALAQSAPADQTSGFGPLDAVKHAVQDLDKDGVHLRAQVIVEPATNPLGGVHQSSTMAGQVQFGADLDLNKLVGIPGASFHTTVFQNFGPSLSARDVGVDFAVQEIYKNKFEHVHPGVFAYEQKLWGDRVDFIGGRLGTTAYFGHLSEFCEFMNGAVCGIPTILKQQSGLTLPPSSTWGGRLLYNATPHFAFSLGANEINPTASQSYGLDWSTTNSTGFALPAQVGYTSGKQDAYPVTVLFGNVYSTGIHSDPFFNTKGQSLALAGGTARQDVQRDAIYLVGSKTVWRRGSGSTSKISLFGGYVQQVDTTEVYRDQEIAGFVWTGPFESRPQDKFGIEAFRLDLTPAEREFLRDSRIKAGGEGENNPDEYESEVIYTIDVMDGVNLMPSIQYIVHPDNQAIPKIKFVPQNALVLGVELDLNIATLLGVPSSDIE
jgi:porin